MRGRLENLEGEAPKPGEKGEHVRGRLKDLTRRRENLDGSCENLRRLAKYKGNGSILHALVVNRRSRPSHHGRITLIARSVRCSDIHLPLLLWASLPDSLREREKEFTLASLAPTRLLSDFCILMVVNLIYHKLTTRGIVNETSFCL